MAEILIVDDDENMCSAFRQFLESDGHVPIIASNAEDAVKCVSTKHPDLVFLDIRMPGVDGLEALRQIRAVAPDIYVVIMTAYSTSHTSIEAVRQGAFDYLHKPLDLDDVRHVIDKALNAQELSRKATAMAANEWEQYAMVNLVGRSTRMQAVYKLIGLLTTNDVPVLVLGEPGSGKQLVAQTIHCNSGRKDRPFLTVNCENIRSETAEMEIFGRPQSAGNAAYTGRLEKANGGTLFIDEITALPQPAQNKLLHFLKEGTYEQSGGTEVLAADVRIIAATSADLADRAKQAFSSELHDALRLISIDLPRLKDRLEDIPELVHHFVRRHSNELHKNIKGLDDRVLELLQEHDWPGNVAELEKVIKRACILSRGDVVTVDDVQDALEGEKPLPGGDVQGELEGAARAALQQRLTEAERSESGSLFHDLVGQVESALVREALRITGGNQVKAAELLGLNRTTLRKKMNPESSSDED